MGYAAVVDTYLWNLELKLLNGEYIFSNCEASSIEKASEVFKNRLKTHVSHYSSMDINSYISRIDNVQGFPVRFYELSDEFSSERPPFDVANFLIWSMVFKIKVYGSSEETNDYKGLIVAAGNEGSAEFVAKTELGKLYDTNKFWFEPEARRCYPIQKSQNPFICLKAYDSNNSKVIPPAQDAQELSEREREERNYRILMGESTIEDYEPSEQKSHISSDFEIEDDGEEMRTQLNLSEEEMDLIEELRKDYSTDFSNLSMKLSSISTFIAAKTFNWPEDKSSNANNGMEKAKVIQEISLQIEGLVKSYIRLNNLYLQNKSSH